MSDFNFNFNRGNDPLLNPLSDLSSQMRELDRTQSTIEQKKAVLMQLAKQMEAEQSPVSQTPLWDEIDSLTAKMSDEEFGVIQNAPEFKKSSAALMDMVAAIQLQMIRPYVEKSAEGKKILEQHLTNIKFLSKSASAEVDKRLNDFREYTEKYSHMSYDEYRKMKGGVDNENK